LKSGKSILERGLNMFSRDKKQRHCGLQMMDTHVRLIAMDGVGIQWKAGDRHTIELPPGCIQNGKVVHESAVLHHVKSMVADMELQGAQVKLMIPTSNIILRRSMLASLQDQELRHLIEAELRNGDYKVPYNHVIFDYIRLGMPLNESTVIKHQVELDFNEIIRKHKLPQQEDVLVIATRLEVVQAYTHIAKQAELEPIHVEPSLLTMYRGMARHRMHLGEGMLQRFVLLHTDTGFSEISIFDRGVPVFTFSLNASDYASVEAYAHHLQLEFKRIVNYFRLAIFSDRKDLRELYMVGEADWIMKLRQPLGMMFDGNLTLLSLTELLQVNEMIYDPFTTISEQGMRGA
jgi:Tfp pilus assembly PilM family ATPase